MDWFVLGIDPTKDKNAITAAYRQKLRQTNPEDKPEEFKALRAAYEEAMSLADQQGAESTRDESPIGCWMEAIAKLYEDFASRVNPACWKRILASDVCVGLDTRAVAEEALLKFLMEHYYLPKDVWQVLDETFEFSQRAEELYETWPRDFVDHAVLAGIRLDPALEYELFVPGINGSDCDTYRRLYHQANQMPIDEVGSILEQMDALSERHPYGDALHYRLYIETGREQEGKAGFQNLASQYPDNPLLAIAWADLCLEDGNIEEADRIATYIMGIDLSHIGAKMVHAKCLAEKKQYHEAKEIAYEILHASSDNPMLGEQVTELMKAWNEQLILERESRATVDALRYILRVKFGEHHLTRTGIVGDTQCWIEQHQLVNQFRMLRGNQCRHKTALTTAHEKKFLSGIGQPLNILDHSFQVLNFRQHRHISSCAVALALFHDTAAAEIEAVGTITHPGQFLGILAHRVLPCHKAVANDGNGQVFSLRPILRTPDGQIATLTFKCSFGEGFLHLRLLQKIQHSHSASSL